MTWDATSPENDLVPWYAPNIRSDSQAALVTNLGFEKKSDIEEVSMPIDVTRFCLLVSRRYFSWFSNRSLMNVFCLSVIACDAAISCSSLYCSMLAFSWASYSRVYRLICSWRAILSSSACRLCCLRDSFIWSFYWSFYNSSWTWCSAWRLRLSVSKLIVYLRSSSATLVRSIASFLYIS